MANTTKQKVSRLQFGLGGLIIGTNVIALCVWAIIATEGTIIAAAIVIGFLAGLAMPMVALIYLTIGWLMEKKGLVRHVPLASTKRQQEMLEQEFESKKSPFD